MDFIFENNKVIDENIKVLPPIQPNLPRFTSEEFNRDLREAFENLDKNTIIDVEVLEDEVFQENLDREEKLRQYVSQDEMCGFYSEM